MLYFNVDSNNLTLIIIVFNYFKSIHFSWHIHFYKTAFFSFFSICFLSSLVDNLVVKECNPNNYASTYRKAIIRVSIYLNAFKFISTIHE